MLSVSWLVLPFDALFVFLSVGPEAFLTSLLVVCFSVVVRYSPVYRRDSPWLLVGVATVSVIRERVAMWLILMAVRLLEVTLKRDGRCCQFSGRVCRSCALTAT